MFENLFENGGIGYCRGYTILTLYLYPLSYIPETGVLTYVPEMTIIVKLQESNEQSQLVNPSLLRHSQTDEDIIRDLVTNPSILSTYDPVEMDVLNDGTETTQEGTSS